MNGLATLKRINAEARRLQREARETARRVIEREIVQRVNPQTGQHVDVYEHDGGNNVR